MRNGLFSGNPKTEWLSQKGDDHDMRLLAGFWYLAPQGKRWNVPAGSIIDAKRTASTAGPRFHGAWLGQNQGRDPVSNQITQTIAPRSKGQVSPLWG